LRDAECALSGTIGSLACAALTSAGASTGLNGRRGRPKPPRALLRTTRHRMRAQPPHSAKRGRTAQGASWPHAAKPLHNTRPHSQHGPMPTRSYLPKSRATKSRRRAEPGRVFGVVAQRIEHEQPCSEGWMTYTFAYNLGP
jgi:hypothetical protein